MKVGFKTGPRNFKEGKKIVRDDGAKLCELWFNVTELSWYDEMINWLSDHGVKMGLHHWGVVDGKYKTNLSSADRHIRLATIEQIKRTIDIAADIGAVYVNAHPGTRVIEGINLATGTQEIIGKHTLSEREADALLLEAVVLLQHYADGKQVILTIETLPGRELSNYEKREGIFDPGNASLDVMERITKQGGLIANDITHTTGQVALLDNSIETMWKRVMDFSKRTCFATRLLHINTVEPPYNGTDSHGGILDEDFLSPRFPSRDQLKQWLALFVERDDVYVIPEPRDNMLENYRALKVLVDEIS